MAHYANRFDNVDYSNVSDDVRMLYRVRDNDESVPLNTKCENVFVSRDSKIPTNISRLWAINYSDPIWKEMTEVERIENGLPTKFLLFNRSYFAYLMCCFTGGNLVILNSLALALTQFQKIFYPGGVVLKYQRRQNPFLYMR